MKTFTNAEIKLIDSFKKYLELEYMDYINEETISIFAELFHLSENQKEVLRRRFLR